MIYNFLLILGTIFSLPKWLIQKKYRGTILQRLGFLLPKKANKFPTIWIHMVSVGETRAMIPIYQMLKKRHPKAAFFLSSTTKTGHEEAKRSLPEGDGYFVLPIDFSWVMRRLVLRYKPDLFLISESDFWPNLISAVKYYGGKVVLINGKISDRSANYFSKIPKFSKKLFKKIDRLCIQNQEYAQRFLSLYVPPEKITITGNLKLSIPLTPLSMEEKLKWQQIFDLKPADQVITLGSTHEGEEERILPYLADYKVLLVPRHPQRFAKMKKLLSDGRYPNVRLVDQMGILTLCYQLSNFAIVGGSFLPAIGGHNIFEPIQAKIPVIFGPYMETQKELVQLILEAHAGIQTTHEKLPEALKKVLRLSENAVQLSKQGAHPLETTWDALKHFL